jgi:bisphosphoglycerate-dependent phosphoglycerate mutase
MVLMDSSEKEGAEDLKGLYDMAIPLSMPVSVIRELVENFELELLRKPGKMDMTGEVMDREILVLRGDLETVKAAEKYMFEALDRKLSEWSSRDKSEKYKKYYEDQVQTRMKELKDNPETAKNWDLDTSGE